MTLCSSRIPLHYVFFFLWVLNWLEIFGAPWNFAFETCAPDHGLTFSLCTILRQPRAWKRGLLKKVRGNDLAKWVKFFGQYELNSWRALHLLDTSHAFSCSVSSGSVDAVWLFHCILQNKDRPWYSRSSINMCWKNPMRLVLLFSSFVKWFWRNRMIF